MDGDDWRFDESDDELDDELTDEPDDGDHDSWDEDDATETVACPECGAEVYEDAVRCPVCGHYITHGTSVWQGRPAWWIVLGLVGVVAAIAVLAGLVWL